MSFIVKKKPRQLEVRSVMVLKAGCELAFPDRKSRFFTTMLGVTNVTLTVTNRQRRGHISAGQKWRHKHRRIEAVIAGTLPNAGDVQFL
jgi:hypothetical protein